MQRTRPPSSVSFRDQHYFLDERRLPYRQWTRLQTYVHAQAARRAILDAQDKFEKIVPDPLPVAKELYSLGVIRKHTVDSCDQRLHPDIPDYPMSKCGFLISIYHAVENNFKYWNIALTALRKFSFMTEAVDEMEREYEKNLVVLEWDKYKDGDPPLGSLEDTQEKFERICLDFEAIWNEAANVLRQREVEKVRGYIRYCYTDHRETMEMEQMTDMEEILRRIRKHLDIFSVRTLESLMNDLDQKAIADKIVAFSRRMVFNAATMRISEFAEELRTNPLHKRVIAPSDRQFMVFTVNWDMYQENMFRYFYLIEVAFASLIRHMTLWEIDEEESTFTFLLPDWMRSAMERVTREKAYTLYLHGVVKATAGNVLTMTDPRWGLRRRDHYEYMTSIARISQGQVNDVYETLQGRAPIIRWADEDLDKRQDSIEEVITSFADAIPVAPLMFTFNNFTTFFEMNHLWISHPFYTRKKGYKMCVIVYPRGTGTGLGTHLSLGVCLMRGEHDSKLKFPVNGRVTLCIRNNVADHSHKEVTLEFNEKERIESRSQVEYGDDFAPLCPAHHTLLPIANLDYNRASETQYLVDDTLYIQLVQTFFPNSKLPREN